MVPTKLIFVLLIMTFAAVNAVPDSALCCKPGMGVFQKDEDHSFCWDEKTNKTMNVSLQCDIVESASVELFDVHVSDSGVFYFLLPARMEAEAGSMCLANETVYFKNGTSQIEELVVYCYEEDQRTNSPALYYCMIVSAVFLTLTTIVYAALPELRDLQGKSIVNFCGSLAIGLILIAVMNLVAYSDMGLCAARGFFVYFFILASFFWTNAIAIQILLSMSRPIVNNYGWKEFCWYALYAWGCPTILTVCMAIVNFHPGDHLKPGIGLNHCWFFNKRQQWYYMYSVMSILIVVNICIFIYISTHLWRASFSSSHVKALKYKFNMTLRMIIVMGLPWIFEMISSVMPKHFIWSILDFFNILQGLIIFLLLVVFRKRVVKALLKRGLLDCIAGPVEKYLAVRDDDEEGVMQQILDVTMDQRNGI